MTVTQDVSRLPERDERKPRKSAFLRVIGWLIGWGIILGAVGGAVAAWAWFSFTAAGPLATDKIVYIEKGLNRTEISQLLADQGVISQPKLFSAAAAASALRGRYIKPGEYQFDAGGTMRDALATLVTGRVLTYKLTIPEGWTAEMAVARLRENDILEGDIASVPQEGALLANTFVFSRGMSREKMLTDMREAQAKLVDELWAKKPVDSPLKTKEDMVTLASIVEKETGKPEERPQVAAVFLNRLKQGMRLQSDPTIIYGLVGGKGKLDRPLTRADIDKPTPYNTYTIDGLPPGPIAIPGKASLEAVINPAKESYLYFVADGSGGHAFAHTLDEHNANVAKWRKIENQPEQETASPAPEPAQQTATAAQDVLAQVPLDDPVEAPAAEPAEVPPSGETAPAVAQATAPPTEPTAAEAAVPEEPVLDLKPGTVIQVSNKLIPVPAARNLKN